MTVQIGPRWRHLRAGWRRLPLEVQGVLMGLAMVAVVVAGVLLALARWGGALR